MAVRLGQMVGIGLLVTIAAVAFGLFTAILAHVFARRDEQKSVFYLRGKRVLFYGPAQTERSLSPPLPFKEYDVVIITNNMVDRLDQWPLSSVDRRKILLVSNGYFSTNHPEKVVRSNAGGVLCTTLAGKRALLSYPKEAQSDPTPPGISVRTAKRPQIPSWPLGLSFVLEFARHQQFTLFDIVGVTFYDNGQQYVPGYKLLDQGTQHNPALDKEFTLQMIKENPNIYIDYTF